jgi:uncharacterized membrane protein HdeD (DUF308 family)
LSKKWMPIAAGIIDIFTGAFSIIISGYTTANLPLGVSNAETFFFGAVLVFIAGVLAIVGGVYAIQRKKWYLVLTGAITASFALVLVAIPFYDLVHPAWAFIVLLGIVAIILTVLSKKEFD